MRHAIHHCDREPGVSISPVPAFVQFRQFPLPVATGFRQPGEVGAAKAKAGSKAQAVRDAVTTPGGQTGDQETKPPLKLYGGYQGRHKRVKPSPRP